MEMSGQLHVLATFLRRNHLRCAQYRRVLRSVWTFWKQRNLWPLQGHNETSGRSRDTTKPLAAPGTQRNLWPLQGHNETSGRSRDTTKPLAAPGIQKKPTTSSPQSGHCTYPHINKFVYTINRCEIITRHI